MLDLLKYYYRVPDELVDSNADLLRGRSDELLKSNKYFGGLDSPISDVESLLFERYIKVREQNIAKDVARSIYYMIRPLLGVKFRRRLQRLSLKGWENILFPAWPVDTTVDCLMQELLVELLASGKMDYLPFVWFWPRGFKTCITMTHDVETAKGLNACEELMDLDDEYGVKSSFQIIPERRYKISMSHLESIKNRGFEVNVHDLNHDGRLFCSEKIFKSRAKYINYYGNQFGARGFRSGVMYRRQDWMQDLTFAYDMSVPNVAHLDPQKGGCCTIFPYHNGNMIEIPLTCIQDYSLFNILDDYSIDIWREQCAIISERYGLISLNVHPDYIAEEKPRNVYKELLKYLSADLVASRNAWLALPGQISQWWNTRRGLHICRRGSQWEIAGENSQDATIAYAYLDAGELRFKLS